MKTILVAALILMAVTVYADTPTSVTLAAYSSASSITCGKFGMGKNLRREIQPSRVSATPIQGFALDPAHSETLTLGTKGTANITLTDQLAFTITCRVTGTNTLTPVKMYMNGVSAHFLTVDVGTFVIGQ